MDLGAQQLDSLAGTKYPFSQDSRFVSDKPVSTGLVQYKLPCDMFDEVVIDTDPGVQAYLSGIEPDEGYLVFSLSGNGTDETFQVSGTAFDRSGRLFYASRLAFVRIHTRYKFRFTELLRAIWKKDGPVPRTPFKVYFDPHCIRVREKRLVAFSVHGGEATGDVVLKPGYNILMEQPDYTSSNNISISASAGMGEGRVPCEVAYPDALDSTGIAGAIPDADGNIRFETDGCYSIIPLSDNDFRIIGHCRQCCSCEGDYLPAAQATNIFTQRLDAAYEALVKVNTAYNSFIAETQDKLNRSVLAPLVAASSVRSKAVAAGEYAIRTGMTFANMTLDSIRIKRFVLSVQTGAGGIVIMDLSDVSKLVEESNGTVIDIALAAEGLVEVSRTLQVGPYAKLSKDAVLPAETGIVLGTGLEMYVASVSRCYDNSPVGTPGPLVCSSPGYSVEVTYCKVDGEGNDGEDVTETVTGEFKQES